MRIDIPANESWIAISEELRKALPFQDPSVQVQAYAGYQHALYEATHGLARLFSHKKTIAIVEPAEPALEAVAIAFSEEAYVVKRISASEFANTTAWLDPIASDLIFVACAEDDPVTGGRHDLSVLDEALKDKRVFRVKLSHAAHRESALAKPASFEVRILSLRPDIAAVIAGERFRVSPLLAAKLNWTREAIDFGALLAPFSASDLERRRQSVLNFEGNLPAGFKAYFMPTDARVFDRAVFFHPSLDGSAVVDELTKCLQIQTAQPGNETYFEATSPCRWSHPRFTQWLLDRGEAAATVRGMIMIDADCLNERTRQALEDAAAATLRIQSGHSH